MLRGFRIVAFLSALVYALRYLGLALNRGPNQDEMQSLVNAFDASRGLRLYRDYWDNHGPALTWLLEPLVRHWPDDHNLLLVCRVGVWGMLCLSALLVYRLAHTMFPARQVLPALAPVLFFFSTPVLTCGIEIRPDTSVVLLWAACLLCLVCGLKSRRQAWWVGAGLLLGMCACFTIKVLPLGLSVVLLLAAAWYYRVAEPASLRVSMYRVVLLGVGFVAPVAVMVLILWHSGSLEAWYLCVIKANVERPKSTGLSPFTEYFEGAPLWIFLSLLSCGAAAWRTVKRCSGPEVLLLGPAAFLMFQFVFLLPTKFPSSLLAQQVPQAVLNSWLLCEAGLFVRERVGDPATWQLHRRLVVIALLFAAVALVHWEYRREEDRYGRFWNSDAPTYVQFANRCAKVFGPGETGFDPGGYLFLRPKPGVFHVLVTFLRQLHGENSIDLNLPALIHHAGCKYIVYDLRADNLRSEDLYFLRSQYFPVLSHSVFNQSIVFAAAGQKAKDAGQNRVAVSSRYEHYSKSGSNWVRLPLGWLRAGQVADVPKGDWIVAVGAVTRALSGDQFGKWNGYKSAFHSGEDGAVRSSPDWLLRYVPLTGDRATLLH